MDQSQRRLTLQTQLQTLAPNVYFQPPASVKMQYPAIVYHHDDEDTQFADNKPYRTNVRYMITIIDPDPDSSIRDKVSALPMCTFNRFYTADNLNHYVYNLYF